MERRGRKREEERLTAGEHGDDGKTRRRRWRDLGLQASARRRVEEEWSSGEEEKKDLRILG